MKQVELFVDEVNKHLTKTIKKIDRIKDSSEEEKIKARLEVIRMAREVIIEMETKIKEHRP